MAVVLDTCTWLWLASESEKLSAPARDVIRREKRQGGLVVSVFSAWETAKLVEKGKLRLSMPCREWVDAASRLDGLMLYPLTPEICVESTELPGSFHGDSADQIIVATARVLSAPIVTPDRRVVDYPHVATLW